MKKIASILLVLMLVLATAVPALAEGGTNTGSITIKKADNVSVAGKTFNAYKILDVEIIDASSTTGYVYTVPEGLKSFYATRYNLTNNTSDFDYEVAVKINAETDKFAFAAAVLAAAKAAGITPATATADENDTSVTINNLPLGYYVIEDVGEETPISALMLQTLGNIEITLKADKPSITKKIDGDTDTDGSTRDLVDANNAAIGDVVPYKVTSKVPDMTGYKKYYFVVTDTLSDGLTFNDDVAVTIGEKTLTKSTDFTVEIAEDGRSFEIIFKNFIQYANQKDADIVITYSATLNENAEIGSTGNPNSVSLKYSNNPNITDNGTTDNPDKPTSTSPTGVTPEDIVITYVTGIELIKVNEAGTRLRGAEFKIVGEKLNTVVVRKDEFTKADNGTYWKLKDGSYTTDDPNTEGLDQSKYESTTDKYVKTVTETKIENSEGVQYTATTGPDGVLRFDGLSAGTYEITEIKAPDGYNLLENPITINIGWTAPADGVAVGTAKCTWTVDKNSGAVVNSDGIITLTVENKAGAILPTTGGMGTTIFYVLGGLLIVAAGVALVTRRRMSK